MIPKKIHYCWFSNDEMPTKIKRCIESWHKILPDYELVLWNRENFPEGKSKWVDDALAAKKYAFAADYIRSYALYHHGGIYLDSDVEVRKPFDSLLHLPYFMGRETISPIESAVVGTEKGNGLYKALLDYYNNSSFILEDGSLNMTPMSVVTDGLIEGKYKKKFIDSIEEFDPNPEVINLFAPDFFSPKSYKDGKITLTPNTFSIHHFAGTWVNERTKLRWRLESRLKFIPDSKFKNFIIRGLIFGKVRLINKITGKK